MKRRRLVLPRAEYKVLCLRVFTRDGWKCRHCKNRNDLHAHHVIFRSQLGDDADWNLIALCDTCHAALHNRYLLILDVTGNPDLAIDANKSVKFVRLGGWSPGRRS